MSQAPVLAFLADPATHGGGPVTRIDTHGAAVFLAGDRAYKLKRDVHYPYMDFSTPERRRRAAEAEIALNSLTAPGLYLGVAAVVSGKDGRLALLPEGVPPGGEGALDWVVVMRRFDNDTLFDHLAEAGRLDVPLMTGVADAIAEFHEKAAVITTAGGADDLRRVVTGDVTQLRRFPDLFGAGGLDRLEQTVMAALTRHQGLIDGRRDAGYVRHCHGDLHLGNICLWQGQPTLFDAIEFNESFAVIDVLADLAFLLMDLEHRRLRFLANLVLNRYLDHTGDFAGLALLPLFIGQRAMVRAHVTATAAATRRDAPGIASRRREAVAYFDLAMAALNPPSARLVAVGGLSGTGKTTLARDLAPDIGPLPGAVVLRSDVLRKRLLGVVETVRLDADAYSEEITGRVYGEMAGRAGLVLEAGHGVVCDAVFARPGQRQAIETVARDERAPFLGVWLVADQEEQVRRVAARQGDASDATAEIVIRQAGYDLGDMRWDVLPANGTPDAVAAVARRLLEQARR